MRFTFVMCLFVLLGSVLVQGQVPQWHINPEKIEVNFKIKNFGFWVDGTLSGVEATMFFDPSNLDESKIEGAVSASSIHTDNNTRDKHLRSEDYFHVDKFPKLRMVSTKITQGEGVFNFFGTLTMHGISKDINFPFIFASKDGEALLTARFVVNRQDFEIGPSGPPGDEVHVSLGIAFKKASP